MEKWRDFNQKGEIGLLDGFRYEEEGYAHTLVLEDEYFTWDTMSDAATYAKVVNKLKEYVAVNFQDEATVATRAM